MTWFSHLLAQDPRFSRRARRRRRRMISLEALERRVVLSDVTATFGPPLWPTGTLVITGDMANDNFTVAENADGTVTVAPGSLRIVPGVGVIPPSTINTTNQPFTTGGAVSNI